MDKYRYVYPDYYVVLGSVFYRLNDYKASFNSFQKAIKLLSKSEISSDNKNYLQKYIAIFMVNIAEKLEDKTLKLEYEELFQISIYDERNIKKTFLINFPLE